MTSLLQKKVGRRQWLRTVGAAAMLGSLGRMNALSQNAPPSYKALVCVFLAGGNDGHNLYYSYSYHQRPGQQAGL